MTGLVYIGVDDDADVLECDDGEGPEGPTKAVRSELSQTWPSVPGTRGRSHWVDIGTG